MKSIKNRKIIYVVLSIAVLIANVLPIIIFWEHAAITKHSIPAIAFAFCSSVYAIIAFLNKEHRNLFVLGKNKLFIAFLSSLSDDNRDTDSDEYKKEFALSAFIFCASIPLYIPLAFFAKSFYTALSSALSVTIFRTLFTFLLVLIPPIIKNAQDKKKERVKDEADRKEQERRESMGKWK